MKIGIVTFHFVNNFGGALQAYALQKVIRERCNATVEVIDYRNWFIRFTDSVRLFPVTTNLQEIRSGLATMHLRKGRIHKFEDFIKRYFKMSRRYINGAAIRLHMPECDKFVCGSDQIWNPFLTFGVAEPYYLGFVKESDKKISYAPSFGSSKLPSYWIKNVKKYLSSFGDISVREKEGVALVKQLTGRDAMQLIDPTFLLERSKWNDIAIEPEVKGKYILLYIMQRDEEVYSYARRIKERLGIQLVEISRYGYKPDFVDVSLVDVGPAEFIGLFRSAEYIVTNSYHGLVFSLIFEKEFCQIPCKRFRMRINNLLELLDIEISEVLENCDSLDVKYDREKVIDKIAMEREKAIRYLQKNIG